MMWSRDSRVNSYALSKQVHQIFFCLLCCHDMQGRVKLFFSNVQSSRQCSQIFFYCVYLIKNCFFVLFLNHQLKFQYSSSGINGNHFINILNKSHNVVQDLKTKNLSLLNYSTYLLILQIQ